MKALVVWLLLALPAAANACMFLRDVPREEWEKWSSVLLIGDVTSFKREGEVDVIRVRIRETLKGPAGDTATVRLPARMWASCRMARPAVGERVLVAFHANGDAAIVPTNGAPPGASGAAEKPQ